MANEVTHSPDSRPVVLYARVSTDDPRQAGSIRTQLLRCAAYAEAVGYELVAAVWDEGVSGRTMDRPGWRDVLALLQSGRAELVLATALDRLARTRRFFDFAEWCETSGRGFATIAESLDTSTAMGRMVLKILLAVAEFQPDQTAEKTRAAMSTKAAAGYHTTRPPFGTLSGAQRGIPERDPQHWPVLERMYEQAAAGRTDAQIRAWLNASGIATQNGAAWSKASVARVLTSRFYLGEVRGAEAWHPARHDCRIAPELWHAAQRDRGHRPRGMAPEPGRYLLSGLVVCSHFAAPDGGPARLNCTPVNNGKGRVYPCYELSQARLRPLDEDAAGMPRYVDAAKLEAAVVEWLLAQTRAGGALHRLLHEKAAHLLERRPAVAAQLAQARTQLRRLTAERDILRHRLTDAMLNRDAEAEAAIAARLRMHNGQLAAAEAEELGLQAALERLDQAGEGSGLPDISALLESAWLAGEREALSELIAALIWRIDLRRDGPQVHFYTLPTLRPQIVPIGALSALTDALPLSNYKLPRSKRRTAA